MGFVGGTSLAGAVGIDCTAQQFRSGIKATAQIPEHPAPREQAAFFRAMSHLDKEGDFVQSVASRLELIAMSALQHRVGLPINI